MAEEPIQSTPKDELDEQAVQSQESAEVRKNYLEQLQYLQAEFQNYKRRIDRQRTEWQDDAVRNFIFQLLPVLDDFELYFQHHPADDGVKMIYEKLVTVLKNAGLERVTTVTLFDPELHEAIHVEQNEDVPHGHILEVWQPGYYFKEKLLRPAKVKVAEQKDSMENHEQ